MLRVTGWSGFQTAGVSCLGVEDVAPERLYQQPTTLSVLQEVKLKLKNRIQGVDKKDNDKRQQERGEEVTQSLQTLQL